ncbi:uncharacterized protein LOC143445584 [Clavelina lepadiformis]|uniref:VWFA domain-containing protein n=1 Tax=Clavelina lepadiformis TaxID=159417 RepID=A0ABP0FCQ1_CLALP
MTLWLFVIGLSVFYFLYVTHTRKDNKSPQKQKSVEKYVTTIDGQRRRLSSIFRSFVLSVADPANNNYLDATCEKPNPFLFRSFVDRFQSFEDVSHAMKEAGLFQCRLILGIDFTASNEWQGRVTNKGNSLHYISRNRQNPYQHIISVLQHTLKDILETDYENHMQSNHNDHDKSIKKIRSGIPVYGFGDSVTKDETTFSLQSDGHPCQNFEEVQECYRESTGQRSLGGPTSYAPIIHRAIELVEQTDQFHILVIIADGQFVNEGPTVKAIVDASFYPLSIIVVGVGDGPWELLRQFDDWLPQRQFDNFQFVEYAAILKDTNPKTADPILALHMFMEVPDQYEIVQQLGYISKQKETSKVAELDKNDSVL